MRILNIISIIILSVFISVGSSAFEKRNKPFNKGPFPIKVSNLCTKARSALEESNTKKAVILLRKATNIMSNNLSTDKSELMYAKCLLALGKNESLLGEFETAMQNLNTAEKIYSRMGKKQGEALVIATKADTYKIWGLKEKALKMFEKSLEISNAKLPPFELFKIYSNISDIYLKTNNLKKAEEYAEKAVDYVFDNRRLQVLIKKLLGDINLAKGNYRTAREYYLTAISSANKNSRPYRNHSPKIFISLGKVYAKMDDYEKALDYFDKAAENAKKFKIKKAEAKAYAIKAKTMFWHNDLEGAYNFSTKALNLYDELRLSSKGNTRRDFLASQIDSYNLNVIILAKLNRHSDALMAYEQSRAKILAESIQGDYTAPPTFEELTSALKPDEAALLYFVSKEDNLKMIIVSNEKVTIKTIDTANLIKNIQVSDENIRKSKEHSLRALKRRVYSLNTNNKFSSLEEVLQYFRQMLANPASDKKNIKDLSAKLYNALIKSAEKEIKHVKKLIISPDGPLAYVPYEALINDKGQYLAEVYTIKYAQSLSVYKALSEREYSTNDSLLAFGGAVYDKTSYNTDNNFKDMDSDSITAKMEKEKIGLRNAYIGLGLGTIPNLPGSLKEVKIISKYYENKDIYTGQEASENTINLLNKEGKLSYYSIIHFAAHGLVLPEFPELSSIVLTLTGSENKENDGYLSASEISRLKLKADFISLSACETGLGMLVKGEGLIGLTQSFLSAGAGSVSVSLWKVADESTAVFMSEIYRYHKEKGLSFDKSINQVKKDFIRGKHSENYKKPFFWAPFVYYGK